LNKTSAAVRTLVTANPNVHLVVSNLPDVTSLPIAQSAAALDPAAKALLGETSFLIQKYNASVTTVVNNTPQAALVDLAGLTTSLVTNSENGVRFGGVRLDASAPGDAPNHLFLADQIHAGTIAQGLIADQFIAAVDTKFGARIVPLSPTQITHYAARVYAANHRR